MRLPDAPDPHSLVAEFAIIIERLSCTYAQDAQQCVELADRLSQYLHTFLDGTPPPGDTPLRPYLLRHLVLLAISLTEQSPPSVEAPAAPFLRGLPNAITRLPHPHRQILFWYYYDGLSLQQIATRLDLPQAEVRRLWKETLHSLRALLRLISAPEPHAVVFSLRHTPRHRNN
jgi:RNA polymerase sigma factor (sigma-70 family)